MLSVEGLSLPRAGGLFRADANEHPLKVRDILRLLERDGWRLVRWRGSHRQYRHPVKSGVVTIAGRTGDDLARGTRNSILKQARLKP